MLTSLTLAKMAEQLILTLALLEIKYLQIMVFQMVFIMSISFNISRAHTMVCVAIYMYTLYIMQCQCAV